MNVNRLDGAKTYLERRHHGTSFIDLPAELRGMIYWYAFECEITSHLVALTYTKAPSRYGVLKSSTLEQSKRWKERRLWGRGGGPYHDQFYLIARNILLVCHSIRAEVTPRLYSHLRFFAMRSDESFDVFSMFALQLSDFTKSFITAINILIGLPTHRKPQFPEPWDPMTKVPRNPGSSFRSFTGLRSLTLRRGYLRTQKDLYGGSQRSQMECIQMLVSIRKACPQLERMFFGLYFGKHDNGCFTLRTATDGPNQTETEFQIEERTELSETWIRSSDGAGRLRKAMHDSVTDTEIVLLPSMTVLTARDLREPRFEAWIYD